jgi:transcriptional regulator with XRE-family HTH domain
MDVETIGTRIGDVRRLRRMSQTELAQDAGLARNTISRIETGSHIPETRTVAAIANALNVSIFDLYEPQEFVAAPKADAAGDRERRLLDELIQTIEEHTDYKLAPAQYELLRLFVGDLKWRKT